MVIETRLPALEPEDGDTGSEYATPAVRSPNCRAPGTPSGSWAEYSRVKALELLTLVSDQLTPKPYHPATRPEGPHSWTPSRVALRPVSSSERAETETVGCRNWNSQSTSPLLQAPDQSRCSCNGEVPDADVGAANKDALTRSPTRIAAGA